MSNYKFETLQLHVGQEQADSATGARAVPIYQTASYVFENAAHAAARFNLTDSGNIYGRLTNSTQEVLEKRIAALEGGVAALAVASGAAAITYTIQALAQQGDHIVAQKTIYGGSYNLLAHTLPQYGITASFVDVHNLEEVEAAIQPNTKAIYLETLGNPNSDIPDIHAVAEIAHKHGLPLVIDNTFGTPYLIRPIEYGADIVVHSATKFIGGHGTSLGGIIVDSGNFDWKASGRYAPIAQPNPSYHGVSFADAAGPAAFVTYVRAILLRDTGAAISPFNAFILLQGVETLSLRLERHAENTKKVVEFLSSHPQVSKVNHPSLPDHPNHSLYQKYFPNGGASIFTFEIKGGQKAAWKFIDNLNIFSLLANVADVKSLVIHPATTTHSQLNETELADQGITPGTIRLSIGTEHIDDIIADLQNGFAAVKQYFKNLNPYLMTSNAASEERLHIPSDFNVYLLPRDLYKKDSRLMQGPMVNFLAEMRFIKSKIIIWIKDECHIATSNLDAIAPQYFDATVNFSATPKLSRGQYPDVEITDRAAEQCGLIKSVTWGNDEATVRDAIEQFKKIKAGYRNLLGVNPCLIIQISNKTKADEELANEILPALNENPELKWMLIVNDSKECDTKASNSSSGVW